MLHPPEHPGATIELGEKDLRLLREAASAGGTRLSLADLLADVFSRAKAAGLSHADWAGGLYLMSQQDSQTRS
jgi:3-hydroxyisobutyrate dehydrogenase-like beta-hydroxyacid dehydrogenase